jgi:hypothetical protein
MRKLLFKHFFIWLILSLVYFFVTEPLIKFLMPEFHDVAIWIFCEIMGLALILLIMTTVLIINIVRFKRRLKALN